MKHEIERNKKISQFVTDWMNGHEPDTFVRNKHGVPIYSAGHSSLNLESFFEELLRDYTAHLLEKRDGGVSEGEIKSEWDKTSGYIRDIKGVNTDAVFDFFKPFLSPFPKSNEWISVEDRLPELKITNKRQQVSVTVWCFDGESVFRDSFDIDLGFHKSITHWKHIEIPSPPNT